jgi:hypothetical protein
VRGPDKSVLWKLLEASPTDWIEWIAAFLAVVALVWLVVRIRAWFREDEGPAELSDEMLLQFKDLHRQGDLSEGEYRSIQNQLLERDEDATSGQTADSD